MSLFDNPTGGETTPANVVRDNSVPYTTGISTATQSASQGETQAVNTNSQQVNMPSETGAAPTSVSQIDDISVDQLKLLGVRESIAKNDSKITGEYYTGNSGRQPDWTTYGEFRWKLTLESLPEVLEYISNHPKSSDSMAKSSFIFRFLMNNINKLSKGPKVGQTINYSLEMCLQNGLIELI